MHSIHTKHISGYQFDAGIGNHLLRMDSPDEPGTDTGPSPKRLMLAALAGCTGIDVVSILEKMKVNFSDLQIDVKADLTETHPKIYTNVVMIYTIRMNEEDRPKMERAVVLSKEKYCGVQEMFRSFTSVSAEIVFLD